jgi:hypothetical protein
MAGAVPRSGREGKTRAGTVLGYAPRLSLPISQSANTSRAWFGWKFVHQTICRGVSIQMSRYTSSGAGEPPLPNFERNFASSASTLSFDSSCANSSATERVPRS